MTMACPECGSTEDLVVSGIAVLAVLGRYQDDSNDCTWSVRCFNCKGCPVVARINDAARDEMFGTAWRDKTTEPADSGTTREVDRCR